MTGKIPGINTELVPGTFFIMKSYFPCRLYALGLIPTSPENSLEK